MKRLDHQTAHARTILQDLCRILADAADDEEIDLLSETAVATAVSAATAAYPVTCGSARRALDRFAQQFLDAYASECPEARLRCVGDCSICGALNIWSWTDHRTLTYGHAYAYALRQQPHDFERSLFPDTRLQPALVA